MKRQFIEVGLVFALLITLSVPGLEMAQAQTFPTKPVTLVMQTVGGFHDLTMRTVIPVAQKYLGQPLIMQHKPGGGGAIAADLVARAEPDGYTLFVGSPATVSIKPAIEGRSKGPDDLSGICRINYAPTILTSRPDRPWKDLKGMIAWAKANPNQLKFGSTGVWGPGEVTWMGVVKETGITSRIVHYDGGGEALLGILGGHVDTMAAMAAHSMPHVKAGKLLCLAIFDDKRSPDFPEVPTAKELGVNVVFYLWVGVLAPKATPRPVIEKLALAFKGMTEDPLAKDMIKKIGEDFDYLGADEFTKFWRAEYEYYKELGKTLKKK